MREIPHEVPELPTGKRTEYPLLYLLRLPYTHARTRLETYIGFDDYCDSHYRSERNHCGTQENWGWYIVGLCGVLQPPGA